MMQGSAPDHDEAHASELTVLGAIMLDNGAYGPAARALTAGSFGDPRHRAIFASMAGLVAADAPIDILTLLDLLELIGAIHHWIVDGRTPHEAE